MFFDASFWCLCLLGQACSDSNSAQFVWGFLFGEFDSGSGRTLAACLTHASRTERPLRGCSSGERVSNTWVICPALWDKPGKLGLIPDRTTACMSCGGKLLRCGMGPRPISLLVGGWPTKATTGSRPERVCGPRGAEIGPRL